MVSPFDGAKAELQEVTTIEEHVDRPRSFEKDEQYSVERGRAEYGLHHHMLMILRFTPQNDVPK